MLRTTLFAVVIAGTFAVGCGKDSPANEQASSSSSSTASPYVGTWVNVANSRDVLSIAAEGQAFVVQDENRKKFVGTLRDGVLRVSGPIRGINILHVKSTDRLVADGDEYRRLTAPEVADADVIIDRLEAQRDSMARMRAIATGWEARATDINAYTVNGITSGTVPGSLLTNALVPVYMKDMPLTDAWDTPLIFTISNEGSTYTIRSSGENRRQDATPPGATESAGADIVFVNGSFTSYPAGVL